MPPPLCQCGEFKICSVAVKSRHIPGNPVGSLLAPTLNPILESASERLPTHAYSGALDQTNAERQKVTPKLQYLEWFGVLTAIAYSLFVASNIGLEFLGFILLFVSAISIGLWAYFGGHRGILLLQFFYAAAGLIGMVRWF